MAKRFLIQLDGVHKKSGKSAYRVAIDLGISHSTVHTYTKRPVKVKNLSTTVLEMIEYYGSEFRDVVSIVDEDDEASSPAVA